jgi:hypothetical protein
MSIYRSIFGSQVACILDLNFGNCNLKQICTQGKPFPPLDNNWSNLQEAYLSLTTKTLVFLQHVTQQYEADFIMKVDDDVYLRTDRLPHVMDQWKRHGAGPASQNAATLLPACHEETIQTQTTICITNITVPNAAFSFCIRFCQDPSWAAFNSQAGLGEASNP